ncbi:MAG TPA: response regulator transcription factor [Acidimicrobiia bacterium]|jgi:DNA-binding NarL/FixJ family response regulator|nr:response regulator transcription factor [Acidimicrobiia bacterium]
MIRVFIVDDHDLFRVGVRAGLGPEIDVVGEASEVGPAVEMIKERVPDVVLLDVHLPGGGGRYVIEGVHRAHPQVAFLALSASDAAADVVGLVRAGAAGYVTKNISPAELRAAIERVAGGEPVFSPRLAGFLLDTFSHLSPADPELDRLSEREREVLQLIARGYTYREAAAELFISIKTIESHVSSVFRKLQLSNRNELTRWAVERKLI